MVRQADQVVLLDSVQYTKRDWRNRNKIKTPTGPAWLTIPVETKGQFFQPIDAVRISERDWAAKHIRSIEQSYAKAAHFEAVAPWLFQMLREAGEESLLTHVNQRTLTGICSRLGIATPICRCTDLKDRRELAQMEATERLVSLASAIGATRYLSGPAAKSYLDAGCFARAGIELAWMDYAGYPVYPQLWGAFDPALSIVDLMLNIGDGAAQYLDRMAACDSPS